METVKRYLSQWNRNKFPNDFAWKSYQSLIALFILGVLLILGVFYFLYEFKVHQFASLDSQLEEYESYLSENAAHNEKLEKPFPPNPAEAIGLGRKVPLERHVPEFLIQLDNISKLTGVELTKLEIEEAQPEQKDMVTIFLKELATLAKDVNEEDAAQDNKKQEQPAPANPLDLSGVQQRERVFVTEPEKILDGYFQQAEQEQAKKQTSDKVTDIPQELVDYLPFGMIRFHIEFDGTYRQLTEFLGHLRSADRLVHVEKWEYLYASATEDERTSNPFHRKINIDFKILYYKEKVEGISDLPPLDPKDNSHEAISVLPKSWIEGEVVSDGQTKELNPEDGLEPDEETQSREKLNHLLKSYSPEPETKD
ncbi:hypothetical protein [Ammoniphilus sp. 3BR4]|uniref:hypothetical protein n=1 Tax=Ammoniphilus sp. 3BR4 TaxID=3158265 RepID=UPI003466ADDC